jgi:hypothetical protein
MEHGIAARFNNRATYRRQTGTSTVIMIGKAKKNFGKAGARMTMILRLTRTRSDTEKETEL